MKARLAIVTAAALAASAVVLVAVSPAHADTVGCRATYTVASQWQGGFSANVAVTNLGSPLTSWTIGFDFAAGQHLLQGWSANWSQSGTHVAATNAAWNGGLATGATVSVGFNGSWTGSNPPPATITLNGVVCDGTVHGPSPSNSPGFTTSPPASSAPPGDLPPTVKLTSPDPNQIYGTPGTLPLAATASDPDGTISKVEFYTGLSASGPLTLVATVTTPPYADNLVLTGGGVTVVQAKAYDNAGLTATDTENVKVAVSDPVFYLTSPNSSTVYKEPGTIQLSAVAGPPSLITKVEFYTAPSNSVPLTLVATITAAPYSYLLNVTAPDSVHLVEAKAYDVAGRVFTTGVLIQTTQ